jgi:ABC-2 type transport system ATP-binding protein
MSKKRMDVKAIDVKEIDIRPAAAVSVVEVRNVTRKFGAKVALDNVSLSVPSGSVFGLVGENGAGKTTLIKHILGLLKPQAGSVRVFGKDPIADPVSVLSRIGYLSEEGELPGWMRVQELMQYAQSFYSTWDPSYAEELRRNFGLELNAGIKNLSKGQRARAGLMMALAYRPDLLLLDEPSSGLDPIVRRDILGAIIRTIADEGRTVLFSSHLLGEVERVSDYVAMVRGGKIVFCDTLDRIKELHFRATFQFETAPVSPPQLDGVLTWEGSGRELTALCAGTLEHLEAVAATVDAKIVEHSPASLDDIFVARVGAKIPEPVEN